MAPIDDIKQSLEQVTKDLRQAADVETARAALVRELAQSSMEATPLPQIVVSESGEIVLVNLQAELLFGYHRDNMVGRQVEMLVPERNREAHAGYRSAYAKRPRVRHMGEGRRLTCLRRDGTEIAVQIMLTPRVTVFGTFVMVTMREDWSERVENFLSSRIGQPITQEDIATVVKTLSSFT